MDPDTASSFNTDAVSVRLPGVSIERPALYVVATPIGNLGDISLRSIAILSAVDRILCEDTRHSRHLLDHYGIKTAVSALHEHNEDEQSAHLLSQLKADKLAYALISDAGTPLICDPGYRLIHDAISAAVPVLSVPGASALVAALSISGLPTDRFSFEGFLPAHAGPRDKRLRYLQNDPRTLIFYEAPHRIHKTLAAMGAHFGSKRVAVVARELTKRFETVYRGELGTLADDLAADANAGRGELVVLVSGAPQGQDDAELERLLDVVLEHIDRKTAVNLVSALSGRGRNEIYRHVLDRAKVIEKKT